MTALTKDRLTSEREGRLVSDPLATGATIYAGSMYVLDAAGDATPATAAATTPVRAVARKRAAHADGDTATDGSWAAFALTTAQAQQRSSAPTSAPSAMPQTTRPSKKPAPAALAP